MGNGSFLVAFLLQCAITALEEAKLSLCHTYGRFAALPGCVNVTVLFKIIASKILKHLFLLIYYVNLHQVQVDFLQRIWGALHSKTKSIHLPLVQ